MTVHGEYGCLQRILRVGQSPLVICCTRKKGERPQGRKNCKIHHPPVAPSLDHRPNEPSKTTTNEKEKKKETKTKLRPNRPKTTLIILSSQTNPSLNPPTQSNPIPARPLTPSLPAKQPLKPNFRQIGQSPTLIRPPIPLSPSPLLLNTSRQFPLGSPFTREKSRVGLHQSFEERVHCFACGGEGAGVVFFVVLVIGVGGGDVGGHGPLQF